MEPVEYVEYHQGGVPGRRPVLRGPNAHKTFDAIPLVDMTDMASSNLSARQAVAHDVGKACSEVGFFYAQNHPVPQDVIDETFDAIREYFGQPHDVKMQNHIHQRANYRGYEPPLETKMDAKTRGDWKEGFLAGGDETDPEQDLPFPAKTGLEPQNNWPANNERFKKAVTQYYNHLIKFSRQLLRTFALALGIEETFFDSMVTFPMSFVRPLHYPPQEKVNGDDVGIGAHTDFSCFTMVCQDGHEALEVLNKNGIWIPAPCVPRTFVINIGDYLQTLTNRRFESTVHRVVNRTGKERYSIALFFMFNEDAELAVIPSCKEEGKEYEKKHTGTYLKERFKAARYKHPVQKLEQAKTDVSVSA